MSKLVVTRREGQEFELSKVKDVVVVHKYKS